MNDPARENSASSESVSTGMGECYASGLHPRGFIKIYIYFHNCCDQLNMDELKKFDTGNYFLNNAHFIS